MDRKTRILFNSEYSQSGTGYSRISKELLERLAATNKYELSELASFCGPNDPRVYNCNWKVYAVQPDPHNEKECKEYYSNNLNAAGLWKFNEACLDFCPDIVFTMRDYWYDAFVHNSPYRKLYNLIWWNPVDAASLNPEWVWGAKNSDICLTYTDFGHQTLLNHGVKSNGCMPIGINFNEFFPIPDKKAIKAHFGYKDDCLVIGFVARNQPRKLFQELLESFTSFLIHGPKEITKNTYLYLNTKYPDVGFDLPKLIQEYGISNKVFFSYICEECKHHVIKTYSGTGIVCENCGHAKANLPNINNGGLPTETLNLIYNFCDVYCHLATCEGFGIPIAEAAACGTPVLAINYSGVQDILSKCQGFPINVYKLQHEADLGRLIAIPDNKDFVSKLLELLRLPNSIRQRIGYSQALNCRKHFDWNNSTSQLMNIIDKLPQKQWNNKVSLVHEPNLKIPNGLTNDQFVYYLYEQIIGRKEMFYYHGSQQKIYNLAMRFSGNKSNFSEYNREMAISEAIEDNKYFNKWETLRLQKFGLLKKVIYD